MTDDVVRTKETSHGYCRKCGRSYVHEPHECQRTSNPSNDPEMVEWLHAKDLSRRSTRRGMRRLSPEHFYDPHAATELGALIHTYMSKPARTT